MSDMDNPIFCVRMSFANKKQLKNIVKNVNIKDGVKKNKIRLRVVCQKRCKWTLYARKMNTDPNDPTFQIRTYRSKHNCCKEYVNRNMDYK